MEDLIKGKRRCFNLVFYVLFIILFRLTLNLATNRERFNGIVVIRNEIHHLMAILPQLLRVHWLQSAVIPLNQKSSQKKGIRSREHKTITTKTINSWKRMQKRAHIGKRRILYRQPGSQATETGPCFYEWHWRERVFFNTIVTVLRKEAFYFGYFADTPSFSS